ncbi:MAG: alpha/beta hydrolase [Ferruginibacter sp.]
MKQKADIFLVLFLLFIPFSLFSQQQKKDSPGIKYGDNSKAGKYLSTRGIKMYYEIYGKGQPLLMIHGNGGSIKNFKYQLPYFEKYYKVIAVDSRAQGRSTDTGDSLNYEMMADDFNALLDSLHIDSAYVIGWSDGGINGLLLSIRHPGKVKKLAITGANLTPDLSVLDASIPDFFTQYKAIISAQKQDANSKNAYKLLHMMEIEPNIPLSDLHKIKCPALVIGGDHDAIKPVHTLQIYENIPQAYLWILPASGHGTLQRYKDDFNRTVHNFFTQPYKKITWMDFDE